MDPDQHERDRKVEDLLRQGKNAYLSEDYAAALEAWSAILQLDPSNILAWANRSGTYWYLKKYQEALDDAKKAVEVDPGYSTAWVRMGKAYFSLHQPKEARKGFVKALELQPDHAEARKALRQLDRVARVTTSYYLMEGYLEIKVPAKKKWDRRYVCLSEEKLVFYKTKDATQSRQTGEIFLKNIAGANVPMSIGGTDQANEFDIVVHEPGGESFIVNLRTGKESSAYLSAQWVSAIKKAAQEAQSGKKKEPRISLRTYPSSKTVGIVGVNYSLHALHHNHHPVSPAAASSSSSSALPSSASTSSEHSTDGDESKAGGRAPGVRGVPNSRHQSVAGQESTLMTDVLKMKTKSGKWQLRQFDLFNDSLVFYSNRQSQKGDYRVIPLKGGRAVLNPGPSQGAPSPGRVAGHFILLDAAGECLEVMSPTPQIAENWVNAITKACQALGGTTTTPAEATSEAPAELGSLCHECEQTDAIFVCDECEQNLCTQCDERMHRKGNRAKHKRVKLPPKAESPAPAVEEKESKIEESPGKQEAVDEDKEETNDFPSHSTPTGNLETKQTPDVRASPMQSYNSPPPSSIESVSLEEVSQAQMMTESESPDLPKSPSSESLIADPSDHHSLPEPTIHLTSTPPKHESPSLTSVKPQKIPSLPPSPRSTTPVPTFPTRAASPPPSEPSTSSRPTTPAHGRPNDRPTTPSSHRISSRPPSPSPVTKPPSRPVSPRPPNITEASPARSLNKFFGSESNLNTGALSPLKNGPSRSLEKTPPQAPSVPRSPSPPPIPTEERPPTPDSSSTRTSNQPLERSGYESTEASLSRSHSESSRGSSEPDADTSAPTEVDLPPRPEEINTDAEPNREDLEDLKMSLNPVQKEKPLTFISIPSPQIQVGVVSSPVSSSSSTSSNIRSPVKQAPTSPPAPTRTVETATSPKTLPGKRPSGIQTTYTPPPSKNPVSPTKSRGPTLPAPVPPKQQRPSARFNSPPLPDPNLSTESNPLPRMPAQPRPSAKFNQPPLPDTTENIPRQVPAQHRPSAKFTQPPLPDPAEPPASLPRSSAKYNQPLVSEPTETTTSSSSAFHRASARFNQPLLSEEAISPRRPGKPLPKQPSQPQPKQPVLPLKAPTPLSAYLDDSPPSSPVGNQPKPLPITPASPPASVPLGSGGPSAAPLRPIEKEVDSPRNPPVSAKSPTEKTRNPQTTTTPKKPSDGGVSNSPSKPNPFPTSSSFDQDNHPPSPKLPAQPMKPPPGPPPGAHEEEEESERSSSTHLSPRAQRLAAAHAMYNPTPAPTPSSSTPTGRPAAPTKPSPSTPATKSPVRGAPSKPAPKSAPPPPPPEPAGKKSDSKKKALPVDDDDEEFFSEDSGDSEDDSPPPPKDSDDDLREKLIAFYKKHSSDKLVHVDEAVRRYGNKQELLWKRLYKKYNCNYGKSAKNLPTGSQEKSSKPACPVLLSTGLAVCPLLEDKAHLNKYFHKNTTASAKQLPRQTSKPDMMKSGSDRKLGGSGSGKSFEPEKRGSVRKVVGKDFLSNDPPPPPSYSPPPSSPPAKMVSGGSARSIGTGKQTSKK